MDRFTYWVKFGVISIFAVFYVAFYNGQASKGVANEPTPATMEVVASATPTPVVSTKPIYQERVAGVSTINIDSSARDFFERTNGARVKSGLKTLQWSPTLQKSAQAKLDDMLAHKYFSHDKYVYFIQRYANEHIQIGENLARNFSSNQETFDAWMASPTHRTNILDTRYTDIGIAVSGSYVVQHFGETNGHN